LDWIELSQDKDRWDVMLWTGSTCLRIRTGRMCGYGLDRACSANGQVGFAVMDLIELAEDTDR